MRQIFNDVPVIYGFSSKAPVGPIAASTLDRYFRASGKREIARGHPSGRLLGYFAPFALSVTQGMTDKDPHVQARREMCQFADDRLSDATKLDFVHQLLQRHIGETRLQLDRIQRLTDVARRAGSSGSRRWPGRSRPSRATRRPARAFSTTHARPTMRRRGCACSTWRAICAGCRRTSAGRNSR